MTDRRRRDFAAESRVILMSNPERSIDAISNQTGNFGLSMGTRHRKDTLLVREVAGEVLILDTEADRIHQLNASASVVWRLYQSGAEVAEIASQLAIEFDVDNHRAETDVQAVLEQFRAHGLIS